MNTSEEADAGVMARWLCSIGYGFDFVNQEFPLPQPLRLPLAQAWYDRDYSSGQGLPGIQSTVDDYCRMLDEEGAW